MSSVPTVRRLSPDEWRLYRVLRLSAMRDAPDAFGSTLARERGFADEEWQRRLVGDETAVNAPLVAEVAGEAIGLAWGRIESATPDVAHLYQMWVDPLHRGRGAGRLLLDAVVAWARERGASKVQLGVTEGDTPARRLYERAGFEAIGDPEPLREGSEKMAQTLELALRPPLGKHD